MAIKKVRVAAAVLVLFAFALFAVAMTLNEVKRPVSVDIPATAINHRQGLAFTFEISPAVRWPWRLNGDDIANPRRSWLVLTEDGVPLHPPHTVHANIEDQGGGAYSYWRQALIFSSSDGSDPRHNGRQYSVVTFARLARMVIVVPAVTAVILLIGGIGALAFDHRLGLLGFWRSGLARLRLRRHDIFIAALVPTAASAIAWLRVPFLWNGSDSAIWLRWQWELFPHFPMLYPAMMAAATQAIPDRGTVVVTVVALQHLLAIAAVVYLGTAFRRRWQILLLASSTVIGLDFNLVAHGLFTESIALPCLVMLAGAMLRLKPGAMRPAALGILFLALLLGMLTRHIFILFAAMPFAYLLLAGVSRQPPGNRRRAVTGAAIAATVAAGACLAALTINQFACITFDKSCTSILGRAGIYRVLQTYGRVPESERALWLASLGAHAKDDRIAATLAHMARSPDGSWVGAQELIHLDPALAAAPEDYWMNAAFKFFAFSGDREALGQWLSESKIMVFGWPPGLHCQNQPQCLLLTSAESIRDVFPDADPLIRDAIRGTEAAQLPSAMRLLELAHARPVQLLTPILPVEAFQRSHLLAASFVLLALAFARSGPTPLPAHAASLWLGSCLYAVALTFITVVVPRYLMPVDLLLWIANGVAVIALIDRHRSSPTDSIP